MNWKRALVGVFIVAILLAGGFFAYQQFFAPEPDTAATSENGSVDGITVAVSNPDIVSAEGQIVPLRNAMLSFTIGGELDEIIAQTGTAVAAGDPILRLDTTDQEIAVIQADAGLVTAKANLETAKAGLQAAQTAKAAAEIGIQSAQADLAIVTAEPTAAEIALQQSAIDLAEAGIAQAGANQSVVLEGAGTAQARSAEAQIRAAEAQLLQAREARDVLLREDNPDEDDVANVQRRYNAAVAGVTAAQAGFDEVLAGATSGQRQAAFGGVASAAAQRDAAQSQLELLLAGAREEQITVVEAAVAQAEAALAEADLAIAQSEASIAQAEAGVAQAQAVVDSAKDSLEKMTMSAPFDGVVADITVEEGEVVGAGLPVIMFGDLTDWQVETTDLTELDVVALKVGDQVEVQVDAIPGETLTGTVTDIATTSTLTRGDVTYTVTILLDEAAELPLRWGMTVFVDVDVDQG